MHFKDGDRLTVAQAKPASVRLLDFNSSAMSCLSISWRREMLMRLVLFRLGYFLHSHAKLLYFDINSLTALQMEVWFR